MARDGDDSEVGQERPPATTLAGHCWSRQGSACLIGENGSAKTRKPGRGAAVPFSSTVACPWEPNKLLHTGRLCPLMMKGRTSVSLGSLPTNAEIVPSPSSSSTPHPMTPLPTTATSVSGAILYAATEANSFNLDSHRCGTNRNARSGLPSDVSIDNLLMASDNASRQSLLVSLTADFHDKSDIPGGGIQQQTDADDCGKGAIGLTCLGGDTEGGVIKSP
mmetsp:Transcript_69281/g.130644  ORF Transcript_69281/g.130644 Transcript_69281/m.130644 type:complete len:220 (-) Transcript_69281:144-803(-)